MSLLSRKCLFAVAAVVDIAVHGRRKPVSAKALATRHGLPPRHLEPVLQALVHDGILKGIRGPRGGYELGREQQRISLEEIVRAAERHDGAEASAPTQSPLFDQVILPAVAQAELAFIAALSRTSVDDLLRRTELTEGPGPSRPA